MKSNKILSEDLSLVMIFLGAISRLLPHPPNVTPIDSMALFGGSTNQKYLKFLTPVLAMFVSDLFLPKDGWTMRLVIYTTILVISVIGSKINTNKWLSIYSCALLGSLLFYFSTNIAVVFTSNIYPHNHSGIIMSLIAGLPFYRNTLIGDLGFTTIFFGVYKYALKNSMLVVQHNNN